MSEAKLQLAAALAKATYLITKSKMTELVGIGNYGKTRSDYGLQVSSAIQGYLYDPGAAITTYKTNMRRAMYTAFIDAFESGWIDGGADLPVDKEGSDWLAAKQEAEAGYISMLFEYLKELKKTGEQYSFPAVIRERTAGYQSTLDGVYTEGKLRGMSAGTMATLDGDDGEESCPTCQKLKGKSHRVSWWVSHGLIPGQPGNGNYECHGYNCRHYLFNSKTGELIAF
jgi:hypothetical protein